MNVRPEPEQLIITLAFQPSSLFHFALSACTQTDGTLLKSRGEGVKSFSCNKEGPAYPRVLYLETRTRYAHMQTWRTNNHYFWWPVSLFIIEWFVVGAKNGEQCECTRDTTAASFVALLIVSMSLDQGNFKPYCFPVST